MKTPEFENVLISEKGKRVNFKNDPFSENENDLVSAPKRKHFSFALYIEERKRKTI